MESMNYLNVNTTVNVLICVTNQYRTLAWSLHEKASIGDGVLVPYKDITLNGIILGKSNEKPKNLKKTLKNLGPQTSEKLIKKSQIISEKYLSEPEALYKILVPHKYYSSKIQTMQAVKILNTNPYKTTITNVIQPLEKQVPATAIEYITENLENGQILVILPSVKHLEELYNKLPNKIRETTVRLDSYGSYEHINLYVNGYKKVALGVRNNALQYAVNLQTILVIEDDHIGHMLMTKPHISSKVIIKERLDNQNNKLIYVSSNTGLNILTKNVKTVEKTYKGYNVKLVDLTELPYSERVNPRTILSIINNYKQKRPNLRIGYVNTINPKLNKLAENLKAEKLAKTRQYDIIILENLDKIIERPTLKPGYELKKYLNNIINNLKPEGTLIIETQYLNHPILQAYEEKNHTKGLQWQHSKAKQYMLPPYGKIIKIETKNKRPLKDLGDNLHGGATTTDKKQYAIVLSNSEYEKYKENYRKLRSSKLTIY